MCVKEFIGYKCGHCSVPEIRQCPTAAQEEQFPTCAYPAHYPNIVDEFCPACFRIVWTKDVLRKETEHQQLHQLRLCQCELIFDEKERAERMEVLPHKEKVKSKGGGKGEPTSDRAAQVVTSGPSNSSSNPQRGTLCDIMRRDIEDHQRRSGGNNLVDEVGSRMPNSNQHPNTLPNPSAFVPPTIAPPIFLPIHHKKSPMTFYPGEAPYNAIQFEKDESGWGPLAIVEPAVGNYPTVNRPSPYQNQCRNQHLINEEAPVSAAVTIVVDEDDLHSEVTITDVIKEEQLITPTDADISGIYRRPIVVSSEMYHRGRRGSAPG